MKKILLTIINKHFFVSILLGIIMLCMSVTSQNVFAQKIVLTTGGDEASFKLIGEGDVIINWGDDKIDRDSLEPNLTEFKHSYLKKKSYTVTITCANIIYLDCRSNNLTSLDVSGCSTLTDLYCEKNELTSLDVSKNIELKTLWCGWNKLTSLDVSKNIELKTLWCNWNNIPSLDVSKNIKLKDLDYSGNNMFNIPSLDVSKNIELETLACGSNNLPSLDVSKNIKLKDLDCKNNKLTYPALNALFKSLPKSDVKSKKISIDGNPGYSNCDQSIAKNKGWRVSSK